MKNSTILSILAFCLLTIAVPAESAELSASKEQEYVARYLARFFPRQHLAQLNLDDSISERIWINYISRLDYERVFFLQSDIDSFQKRIHDLDDDMKNGDLSFAFEIFDVFKQRLTNRCAYAETLVAKEYDFSEKESYVWRRKDAPWIADNAEWDDLWRKRIKNELLRYKISEILKKEQASKEPEKKSTNDVSLAELNITPPTPAESIAKRYNHLRTIITDHDADYVVQRFLNAFANAYDPHSSYLSPSALDDFDIEMKLSLVGIGAVLQSEDGAAKIIRLIAGGPASQDKSENKLASGDKIVAVGQGKKPVVDVLHWPLTKIVQKIRGEKGTTVVMLVIPASDPSGSSVKTVTLVRDEVKLEEQAVKWATHTPTDSSGKTRRLAVIDVPAFYANLRAKKNEPEYRSSADDVAKAINEISTNNVSGIILDLRNNGGGSLVESVRMTGLFVDGGPAVQIKESSGRGRILTDPGDGLLYDGPLIVLMNRLSASASEIVAAALKDYGRAILVGDSRTHGKGTVQTVVNVGRDPQYGAIKLTTAGFYRISGDSTQLRGVIPDIYIPSPLDYMELGEDSLKYPVEWDRIRRCQFEPYDDPSETLDIVRKQSLARRKSSEAFNVYKKLLEQMKSVYEADTVPLDLESRLTVARSEKEMSELQRKLSESSLEGHDDATPPKDIMLEECLQILADLVSLEPVVEPIEEKAAVQDTGILDKVKSWVKEQ
jgi:carboxyl-terminal processing protease